MLSHRSRATRRRCSAASRSSAANARTVSMFRRVSATCPDTRATAASRWSTIRCRRRIRGTTIAAVAAIIPASTTTSSGSYCQSTAPAKINGTTLATTENASVSTNSSNRLAKLNTRLVSDPAKFSWKNAASWASSASMPTS